MQLPIEQHEILFDPHSFDAVKGKLLVENYSLTVEELREYAVQASRIRKTIRARADAM